MGMDLVSFFFFFQAEDGIRDYKVTGVQTCALPISLGRPIGGLATIRRPATPLLDYVVNAGAVAVGPDGAVYYAPLVRDEIRKYTPGGQVSWSTKRGLFRNEPDPEFLPAKGAELRLKKALVNVALALGPPPL